MNSPQDLLLHVCAAPADRAWVDGYLVPSLALTRGQVHTRDDDRPGRPRVDEIAEATARARYTLLVLSQAFLSDGLSDYARSLATHAAVHEGRLLLVAREACKLPLQLDYLVRLECLEGDGRDKWDAEMARLREVLGRPEPEAEALPCPYPGLKPFSADQGDLFFGRSAEIETLFYRIQKPGCHMFVIGASGSGKSSLLRAGLLARLARDESRSPKARFRVVAVRPGQAPTAALAGALGQAEGQPLREAALALLAGRPDDCRLLLMIDPLEELFAQGDEGETARFLFALRELRREPRCSIITAMRADFYPQLMSSPLWPVEPEQRVELGSLTDDALRQAIQEPAAARGVHVEPTLLERLAQEASHGVGVLPLLQETLYQLWQRRDERRERRLLTLSNYEALSRLGDGVTGGGASALQVALARHADTVLDTLPEGGELIAERIFVRLVRLGEGGPDTRRQQPESALYAAGDDPDLFAAVLRHLIEGRLLTVSGAEGQAGRLVDLAHEALIKGWPKLAGWLRELRKDEQKRRRLEAKVDEWRRLGCGRGGLLDAEELPEFDAWRKSEVARTLGIDRDMSELVKQSRAALARQRRLRSEGVALLVAFSIAVSVLALGLLEQRRCTEKALTAAIAAANEIISTSERELRTIAGTSAVQAKFLKSSLELAGTLKEVAGERYDIDRVHAVTLSLRADQLLEQGNLRDAIDLYRTADAHFERQAARDPTRADWQRDLSVSREKLGDVLRAAGEPHEARHALRQSLNIVQSLAAQDPGNAQLQRDLSVAHEKLGDMHRAADELDEARHAFEQDLTIVQHLAARDPTRAEWQRDLSIAHEKLGDVLQAMNRPDEARRAFEQSLAIRRGLAGRGSPDMRGRKDLVMSYGRLADLSASLGQRDEARARYRDATGLLDALERDCLYRDDAQMREIRSRLEELGQRLGF